MNIIVKPEGSNFCYCRPDTTWERENRDFYVPESAGELYWTPVIFARVSKAGKCVSPKFVSRYYDAFSFGVLLYCKPEGVHETAFMSCADHTSVLPAPDHKADLLEECSDEHTVSINGEKVFGSTPERSLIEDAICRASQLTSLRIGDYVAAELSDLKALERAGGSDVTVKGEFGGRCLYDFKVIF